MALNCAHNLQSIDIQNRHFRLGLDSDNAERLRMAVAVPSAQIVSIEFNAANAERSPLYS
jgi:hypothetical protein